MIDCESGAGLAALNLPTGTLTMLFTDIDGSTRLLQQLGTEVFTEAVVTHRRLLRDAFAAHGGREMGTEGDSFFVVFRRARDAVAAAVDAQQAIGDHRWPEGVRIGVRMGMHTCEPVVGEEGYHGLGVHRAARIAGLGRGGQIVLSAATRAVVADELDGALALRDLGEHRLKDFDEPERIFEVRFPGAPAGLPPSSGRIASLPIATRLPPALRPAPNVPFVGRATQLRRLCSLLDASSEGGRRIALVGGEPGSGKTRLARELAERATRDGHRVLYGACDPEVRTPYEAVVDALEPALAEAGADPLAALDQRAWAQLRRLLPALGPAAAEDPGVATGADPETERHHLHAAINALLTGLAQAQPLVLILDDLQWADASSLLALRHLGRHLGDARVVLIGLFREGTGPLPSELAAALAGLHRLDGVERLRLAGLEVKEVQELIAHGAEADDAERRSEVAEHLVGLTGGNAFLLGEVWRLMLDRGGDPETRGPPTEAGIPVSVREVLDDRLARLDHGTHVLLELVAVSPRGVAYPVLRAASGLDDEALVAALDEGVLSGMLEEIPGTQLVHRVRHELLRRTIYDEVTALHRATLHLRLAEALEASPERARAVNELALHFRLAAPIAGTGRAIEYALAAATLAERSLVFGEAAARLEDALELGIDDATLEAGIRCRLGSAHHLAGAPAEALESFAAAAELARATGDVDLLVRAAIGFETACWRPGIADPRAVGLLLDAVRRAGAGPSPERVRLLAHLSRGHAYRGDHVQATKRWTQAMAMARAVGDPGALVVALSHAAWTRGERPLDAVIADLTEACSIADDLPQDDLIDVARGMRMGLLVESMDLEAARRDHVAMRARAERAGQPFLAYVAAYYAAMFAICEGRLDAAEADANRAEELGRTLQRGPSAIHGIQMFTIRREQGRLAEVAPVVRLIAGRPDGDGVWGPALAVLLAEIGDADAARRQLWRFVSDGMPLSGGGLGIGALAYAADAAAMVEDAGLAGRLLERLRVLAGSNLVIGSGVVCYGAVDRVLGALAAVVGQWDVAEQHLAVALEINRRLEAPTWIAHTLYEQARMLIRRGGPDDAAAARAPLEQAREVAGRLGLVALGARIEALVDRAPASAAPTASATTAAPATLPGDLSPREVQVLRVIARGLSNREAAAVLHLSEHTVANHLRSILRKTDCANRTQATAYALRHGLADS